MKRLTALLLTLILMMGLAGCGNKAAETPTTVTTTQTVGETATTTQVTATTASTTAATTVTTAAPTTSTTAATRATTTQSTTTKRTVTTTKKAVTTTTTAKKVTTTTKKATTTKAATSTTLMQPEQVDIYAIGEYMTELINAERAAVGAPPLTHRYDLQRFAAIRAAEIEESFSHTRPDGTECFTVFEEGDTHTHFWALGENIAYGYRTVEAVMQGWMDSPGHRENILSTDFNGVIIGYQNYRWVQLFVYE